MNLRSVVNLSFLSSDLAKNISGQVIAVNAGEPAG